MSMFLHEVECESGFRGSNAVQVAEIGIETDLFERTVNGDAEHAVPEGKQTVDRVCWRLSRPAGESAWGEQGQVLEVSARGVALDAEHLVEATSFGETGEGGGMVLGDGAQPGLMSASAVAGRAQEQLAVVMQLACDEGAGQMQSVGRVIVGPVLGQAQVGIACDGATRACEETAVARHPGDRSAIRGTAMQEVVGDGHPVPGDDVVQTDQGEQVTAGPLWVDDPDRVTVELQVGARGGREESPQKLSHPNSLPVAQ
ncbi:hypothetical protein BJP25_21185 [Actinokineospora bangkokensis]|uniref:Uncharacterized protein n=1 Tax=Actinokineospora bangkokensis TaxID=1193682 RepID=A0A1Q9LKJ5_9PSEU|nr:hypothetical protein BJP25_21185 [Actinokineospora bangkokensis]